MKTCITYFIAVSTVLFLFLNSIGLHAEDAPTYRGKVVLVVDRTIASDPDVSWRIERLINDLNGDGWHVLRHDVARGPVHPYDSNWPGYDAWAKLNAPLVREVRALIKADYDAAPTEVKQVLLLGHVPVPYSGIFTNGGAGTGGHAEWGGAHPSDFFYGEMTAQYWSGGWSDNGVGSDVPTLYAGTPDAKPYWEFTNSPGDGKFDQTYLPALPKLAVGRVDLNNMFFFGMNEATLTAHYLDKDHDFRCANFLVQRRAINGTDGTSAYGFCPGIGFLPYVGAGNYLNVCSTGPTWFPYVSGTNSYLLGYGAGFGGPFGSIETVGTSIDFAQTDSRVVFVNLYGSFIGLWDEPDDILRAVLANPYDPANGRFGYGLTAAYDIFGVDSPDYESGALTNRTLGATIGEVMLNQTLLITNVGWALMGDPTLRLHSIQEPTNVTLSKTSSQVVLGWTASPDAAVTGYNIYHAPTRRGPYVLVNSSGPVSGTSYTAARPSSGDPDNFYMIRAVKTETTPIGSYTNMSDGLIFSLPGTLTPYLTILSQPADQKITSSPSVGVPNSVAFSVDVVGADAAGNTQVTYQWYKDGTALSDDSHFKGTTARSLLISGVQKTDVGNYYVVVGNSKLYDGASELSSINSMTSSSASLTVGDPPVAVDDSYSIVRNTPTDLNVLVNDTDPDTANSALVITSVSALSNPSAGTATINPDGRSIHFIPAQSWLGQITFTYVISDGVTPSQATVIINVIPTPGNSAPAVSTIANQQMDEDTTIDIPFTATDDISSPDNLTYVATSSDTTLIPNANLTFTGSGQNRVLHIKGGVHQVGVVTITISVTDEDAAVTTLPTFTVTINPLNIPTLLPVGTQPDGFHFFINGPANSSVEIRQSDDLITWTSLGTVTLSGNIYEFVDAAISSATHRFYAAANQNGCSANKVGFINLALPAGSFILLANQLNNPAGNFVGTLFASLPNGTQVQKWNLSSQGFQVASKAFGNWNASNLTLNPGEGALVKSPSAQTVTFVGDVPEGTQVNSGFPTTIGQYSMMSSIIPFAGTPTLDALGFPAQSGDMIEQWDIPSQQWVTAATYNGTTWSPAVPTVQMGDAFFLQSGSSSARSWTENLPECAPTVSLTSPANGQAFGAPSSIALSATASADAGVAQVEFFQGSTSLGLGTLSGGSYVLTWNNPDSGTYAITAHATDNDGITTISSPANITIQNTLGSEGMSGGNFQFTINGKSGASVEVKASDDLATWTSLGNVTLTGGSYVFSDTSTSSFTHRFYHVEENGVCSANTVGFVSMALPAGIFVSFGNPLNNPAGNVVSTIFAGFPNGTQIQKWNLSSQSYQVASKAFGNWNVPTMPLNPGEGAFLKCPSAQTVIFVGEVPSGTQVNSSFPTTVGQYSMISSIIPRAGTLDALGFPSQSGDAIQQWDVPTQQFVTTGTYNGTAWSPSAPTVPVAGAFFIQSGTSSARSWTETFSPCP